MGHGLTGAQVTTISGGLSGQVALMPLNGWMPEGVTTNSAFPIDEEGGVAQIMPRDATITGVSGYASTTAGLSLVGSTVTLTAQIYTSSVPNNTFTAVPGAICTLAPALTGVLSIGTISDCSTTGLAIPVTAGTRVMTVISATAAGLSLVNSVGITANASITAE
jgi:BclB C-terminal domain-containing protein